MLEGVLDALSTLLQHLHFLIAERHIMEHNEQVVHVPSARPEINCIHDTIGFLQKVERPFKLLFFNEGNGALIELCQHNGYLVLGHSEFFVIMFVEKFTFTVLNLILSGILCLSILFFVCAILVEYIDALL